MGDRGTGKSTTIRALTDLLPNISIIKNDLFNTDPQNFIKEAENLYEIERIKLPMIELPLGATLDRVCGSLNVKEILSSGESVFEPGLLARANRGILYVDEINLLDDSLIDVLLDSAASGWNIVEREGISIKHPANFILVGSGNPEEGDLRPQLLDRFGMYARIKTVKDLTLRVQVIEERMIFDKSPERLFAKYREEQQAIQERLIKAQLLLPSVSLKKKFQVKISQLCNELGIEGLRGDIACTRAAKAFTAFDLRTDVTCRDIQKVVSLCLRHRLHKNSMDSIHFDDRIQKLFEAFFSSI
jgi:magnesium chelatase subunit I